MIPPRPDYRDTLLQDAIDRALLTELQFAEMERRATRRWRRFWLWLGAAAIWLAALIISLWR